MRTVGGSWTRLKPSKTWTYTALVAGRPVTVTGRTFDEVRAKIEAIGGV